MTTALMRRRFARVARFTWFFRLVFVLLLSWGWSVYSSKLVDPGDYLLGEVTKQDLVTRILAEGRVHAFKTVTVGAQVSGQLQKLHVELGDYVKKGQLLAEIDPTIQQNTLLACQAQIRNIRERIVGAEAQLKFCETEFQRNQKLVTKRLVSNSAFEKIEMEYLATKATLNALYAELDKARVELSTAEVNLGYTKIVAPIDGVVSDIITEEGQTVVSTQIASSILVLQDLQQVTIKVKLPEADIMKAKPGQVVYFSTIGQPGYLYHSTLRMIEPAPTSGETDDFSDEAVYYFGLFEVSNDQNVLRPGMTVEVSVILNETINVPVIPVSALGGQLDTDRYLVQVLTPWRFIEQREIVVGDTDGDYIQIKDGLREGEVVVLGDNGNGVTQVANGNEQRNVRKFSRAL